MANEKQKNGKKTGEDDKRKKGRRQFLKNVGSIGALAVGASMSRQQAFAQITGEPETGALGNATRKAIYVLPQLVARLEEIGGGEPELAELGGGLFEALRVATESAVQAAMVAIEQLPQPILQRYDAFVVDFRLIEQATVAIQLERGPDWKQIFDAIKALIKKLKDLLPIPKKWRTIIDLLLELLNILL